MEQTGSCEIKVVDYKTKYIAIGAYDDEIEDGEEKSGELNCEYAIIKADDSLLEALNEIKDESNWEQIVRHSYDSSLIKLISTEFLLFDCSISFFGDNPNLEDKTKLHKSVFPTKNRGKIINLENVEGNFDEGIVHLCGTLGKYKKHHIRLASGEYYNLNALYCPQYSSIVFRCCPDNYTDYRTFPVNIDNLIDFINK